MAVAIVNFIRFRSAGQYVAGRDFQNFWIGEQRQRQGVTYLFAPFAVSPGAGTKGGDRSDSAVVAPANALAVNLFVEACNERWLCEICMVLLDPETFDEQYQITRETWVCSRPEVNVGQETAILRLSSPLDAVDSQVPRRTLSSSFVGSLPSTGSLSVS